MTECQQIACCNPPIWSTDLLSCPIIGPMLTMASLALCPGRQGQLVVLWGKPGEDPTDVTARSTFTSNNESVAQVDDNGLITAIAPGIAGITATYVDLQVTTNMAVFDESLCELTITLTGGCSACADVPYSTGFDIVGGQAPYTVTLEDGQLPAGLTLDNGVISGTPITLGNVVVILRVTDANGAFALVPLTIAVLGITTTSLPDFAIGQAYTLQLEAVGGSGHYGWTIPVGTLPLGLSMNSTGLITGTPTEGGNRDLEFVVVDLDCGPVIPAGNPRATMATVGTTTISTRRGFPEWIPSTGALYKTLTYSGFMKQTAISYPFLFVPHSNEFCAGAKFVFSGASQIDIFGNHISTHTKDMFVSCPNDFPLITSVINFNITQLLGYCWATDPLSCGTCPTDENVWGLKGNFAAFGNADRPFNIMQLQMLYSVTPTVLRYNPGFMQEVLSIEERATFPRGLLNGQTTAWIVATSNGDWAATLSDPYTDADAAASAEVFTSNSNVAENLPNFQTFAGTDTVVNISSKTTSVAYAVNCIDLLVGYSYEVTVPFRDSDGSTGTLVHTFTAAATTQAVTGTVPTPAAGHTITLNKPTIRFNV